MEEKAEKYCNPGGKPIDGDDAHCDQYDADEGKNDKPEVSHTPWRSVPYKERNLPLLIVSVVALLMLLAVGTWGAYYLYNEYGPGANQEMTVSLTMQPNDDPHQMLIQVTDASRSREWNELELIVYIDDSIYSTGLRAGLIDLNLDSNNIGYNFYLVDLAKNDKLDNGDYLLVTNPIELPGVHIILQLLDKESGSVLSTLGWTSE